MSKAQRIVLVSEYFYPANNAPAARFKPLVDELSKRFHVTVFTSKISAKISDSRVKCNWTPFPENTRNVSFRLFFEILYSTETFLRLLFSRYDYYYLTSPSFFNCVAACLYCRLFRRNFVVDIRDDYPRVFFDTGLVAERSITGRILKLIEGKIYKHSAFVVAATAGLQANIKQVYDGEVYLLRNGFSESVFNYNPDKYPVFTLVLHGNLSAFQGIDTILQLGEELKASDGDIQILVIGKGSDDWKLRDLRSNGIIRYLGPKPYHEIPDIISKAHVGLSFRKSGKISEDAFPVRAYEYIGVCLPILVTPLSEAGKYIESLKIGYAFQEDQVSQMVDKIKELKSKPEAYKAIVQNLKHSRLQFSRERSSSQFVQFFCSKINP